MRASTSFSSAIVRGAHTEKGEEMRRVLSIAVLTAVLLLATATSAMAATDVVVNGSFEDGVIAPAITDYDLVTDVYHNSLGDPHTYAIGIDPSLYHSAWASFAAQDGTRMMIVNAAEDPDRLVWGQVVPVVPFHVYQWDAWVRASYSQNPAQLAFMVADGAPVISTTVDSTGAWTKVSGMWTAPAGVTSADLRIVDDLHEYSGDDYAIDNISLTDMGSTLGKATGGIKFMAGTTEVQLDFVAMATERGAKGIVKYTASNGNEFMGRVTGYRQLDDQACFVGEITRTNHAGWSYFYVAVEDNGEGSSAPADEGVRVLAGPAAYAPSLALATGVYPIHAGNVQLH